MSRTRDSDLHESFHSKFLHRCARADLSPLSASGPAQPAGPAASRRSINVMTEPAKLSDDDIEKSDKKDILQALQDVASLSFLQAQKLSGM